MITIDDLKERMVVMEGQFNTAQIEITKFAEILETKKSALVKIQNKWQMLQELIEGEKEEIEKEKIVKIIDKKGSSKDGK